MFKKILFLILFGYSIISQIAAAQINYLSQIEEFLIFNRHNSKIYQYLELKPGSILNCELVEIDTLEVYTRLLLENGNADYQYSFQINDEKRKIQKTAKASKVSRGVNGEKVSAYNKFKTGLPPGKNNLRLSNISRYSILIKLQGKNIVNPVKKIDYIRFTPNFYDKEKILVINDKEYTYYVSKAGKIKLTLQGPIVLKVISRMIFDSNLVNKKHYRYQVFDNREFLSEYTEIAYKSQKAWLKYDQEKIPSTGDVNIIKLDEGIHNLELKDNDKNRDLIFRFYINKSSVGIEEQ